MYTHMMGCIPRVLTLWHDSDAYTYVYMWVCIHAYVHVYKYYVCVYACTVDGFSYIRMHKYINSQQLIPHTHRNKQIRS